MAIENVTVNIRGMHYASWVSKVEKALNGVPGITKASVNLASQSAPLQSQCQDDELLNALSKAVAKAGYKLLKQAIDPQR